MEPAPALVCDLLAATDKLKLMVADPVRSEAISAGAERAVLQGLLGHAPAVAAARPAPAVPADLNAFKLDAELIRTALTQGHHLYIVQLHLQADIEAAGQTPLHYLSEVGELGTLIDTALDLGSVGGLDDLAPADLVCSILFATEMEPDLLVGAFGIPAGQLTPVATQFLQDWLVCQPTLVHQAPVFESVAAPDTRFKPEEIVRIPVSLIEALSNLVGDLTRGRDELVRLTGGKPAYAGLGAAIENLDAIATGLQTTVAHVRCQPIGTLFGRYPRVVFELGQKLGKEIRLETAGDEIEVSRPLIEGLADPLAHLIRNSADHGIELPAERQTRGKPVGGTIQLRASADAGFVRIEIRDDGRGMDLGRIAGKAGEKGLISPAEATAMTPAEIRRLIFAPGFSTATEITDISGRGYGMDVVKTNVGRLGGEVDVESEPGLGTAIIIRLPAQRPTAKPVAPGHPAAAAA
jgi:two-component system chemotaxis sensor kinase CheA